MAALSPVIRSDKFNNVIASETWQSLKTKSFIYYEIASLRSQ